MSAEIITINKTKATAKRRSGGIIVPAIVASESEATSKRFIEFFTVTIRNRNTRAIAQFMT